MLYDDIDLEKNCSAFDEQQADPIHHSVRIAKVIEEYKRRGLARKSKREAALRWTREPGRKS